MRKLRAASYGLHGQDAQALFKMLDVNHDGCLNRDELGRGIRKLCRATEHEVAVVMAHADADG